MPNIYQFKITLKGSKPPIWRRIQVLENYTFWEFHVAINDAMGWYDCHLHAFSRRDPKSLQLILRIDTPFEDDIDIWDVKSLVESKTYVKDIISLEKPRINYEYDFGDGWEHYIILEKILPAKNDMDYPQCIAGKRACPPEDVGAIWGYYDFVEAINNPKHPNHEDMVEWIGQDSWDPEKFDPTKVEFDNPKERWKTMQSYR